MDSMVDAILQARINAERLPGKVLRDIEGKPLLSYVVERVKKAKGVKNIILAIPDTEENDILEKYAKENNLKFFRGSEKDVLSRFYLAAKQFCSKDILRLCADRPLLDPALIDFVIDKYFECNADYISTRIKHTFPEGLTVEVFKWSVLEEAFKNAKDPDHREHVTPYIYVNSQKFKIASVENQEDLSYMRWTIDEEKDVDFLKEVLKNKNIFTFSQIAEFLKNNPEITKINSQVKQVALKEQEGKNFNYRFVFEQ
jgi:spore coat polysaccharide biosynthesis protein SpsF